mmetsp:Transcript_84862/g.226435  ORF Transcript_84862/g.226435 Transcript_84862/m.226435 type:complete len:117 (-) Transcript_84862:215-565(-)
MFAAVTNLCYGGTEQVSDLLVISASLARRLYIRQGTGVGAFAKVYGTKQRRGTLPGKFAKASRGIIRSCLKQLEKVGVVEQIKGTEGKAKGRRVTVKGRQDCDRIANELFQSTKSA